MITAMFTPLRSPGQNSVMGLLSSVSRLSPSLWKSVKMCIFSVGSPRWSAMRIMLRSMRLVSAMLSMSRRPVWRVSRSLRSTIVRSVS